MKSWAASFGFVAVVFALLCAPLLVSRQAGGYADDEDLYYVPAIQQIRAHWPALDLTRDALSALSPGYPYVLATVSFVTGVERIPLRLVTWILSLGLLVLLWRQFPPTAATLGVAALLPLACSNFFVKSASWIVTDNPALLCVTGVLAVTLLSHERRSGWVAGSLAGTATFLRQLHVWTVVPLALRAFSEARTGGHARTWMASLLIPLAVLGLLVAHWHGLVPPAWQNAVALQGSVPAAPLCYLISVFFILGIFYRCGLSSESPGGDWRSPWVGFGAVLGLLIAAIGPTNYDRAAGRWGGYLWSASDSLPMLGHRSLMFLVLAPLGAALLAVMTRQLARQADATVAWLWLGSFLGWAATSVANRLAYHRYYEPTILIFLILWAVLLARGSSAPAGRRVRWLHVLALLQVGITLATAHYNTYGRAMLAAFRSH